ncbi:hypothetical protein LCGC14_1328950 [marine sediment metagenome]|uniref:Uncharacterized protein n=1 Tax=marine sediment metagenome TaxID=412755 RepID=A0A0F9KH68_9ZZZZ
MKMSSNCEIIYKRGEFFIRTGTAQIFKSWVHNNTKIIRYTPQFLLNRISTLMDEGEINAAMALWMRVCSSADQAPIRIKKTIFFGILKIAVAAMAIYAFIHTLLQ